MSSASGKTLCVVRTEKDLLNPLINTSGKATGKRVVV